VVGLQRVERVGRERRHWPPELLRVAGEERVGQLDDVVTAISQRGQPHLDHLEAVVEVRAEGALLDHLRQVAVRGRDEAHVGAARLRGAHPPHLTVLQGAQQP
jgi:hypothetical protein